MLIFEIHITVVINRVQPRRVERGEILGGGVGLVAGDITRFEGEVGITERGKTAGKGITVKIVGDAVVLRGSIIFLVE
jgi:hypothetical protein